MVGRRFAVFSLALAIGLGGVVLTAGAGFAKSGTPDFSKLKKINAPNPCSNDPGVSSNTIKVGAILPQTGASAPSFAASEDGMRARFNLANSSGELGKRKIDFTVADDAGDPARNVTAAQKLVEQDNVFGIIDNSLSADASAKYLNQKGIPVTGWHLGVRHVPEHVRVAQQLPARRRQEHLHELERRLPQEQGRDEGGTRRREHREQLLVHRPDREVDQDRGRWDDQGRLQDHQRDGRSARLHRRGPEDQGLGSRHDGDRDGLPPEHRPGSGGYPRQLQAEDHVVPGLRGLSDLAPAGHRGRVLRHRGDPLRAKPARVRDVQGGDAEDRQVLRWRGWLSADTFIEGIKAAGKSCPTRKAFINNLRLEKNWTAHGAFNPVDFAKAFGKPLFCVYFVQVVNAAFVPQFAGKPFCATREIINGKVTKLTPAKIANA